MTLDELIAAERSAVDYALPGFSRARRRKLYDQMRLFSANAQRCDLPNDVSAEDAWLQLMLRAKDLAKVSPPEGFYLSPAKRGR